MSIKKVRCYSETFRNEMKLGNLMTNESCDKDFDKEKMKQVAHYIINQCGHLENFGKTVLFKLLYFADFNYYELTEKKMTGESYYRLDHGPAPCHFDLIEKELQAEEKILKGKAKLGKYDQYRYSIRRDFSLDRLSAMELMTIEKVIKWYSGMNATEISALSHMDMPYKATKDKEIIDYELVFYRDPALSVREYCDD